jgi:hypothetical protein
VARDLVKDYDCEKNAATPPTIGGRQSLRNRYPFTCGAILSSIAIKCPQRMMGQPRLTLEQ